MGRERVAPRRRRRRAPLRLGSMAHAAYVRAPSTPPPPFSCLRGDGAPLRRWPAPEPVPPPPHTHTHLKQHANPIPSPTTLLARAARGVEDARARRQVGRGAKPLAHPAALERPLVGSAVSAALDRNFRGPFFFVRRVTSRPSYFWWISGFSLSFLFYDWCVFSFPLPKISLIDVPIFF